MKLVKHYSTLGIIICTGREPGPRQHAVWGRMRVTCKKCREALGLPVLHRPRALEEEPPTK